MVATYFFLFCFQPCESQDRCCGQVSVQQICYVWLSLNLFMLLLLLMHQVILKNPVNHVNVVYLKRAAHRSMQQKFISQTCLNERQSTFLSPGSFIFVSEVRNQDVTYISIFQASMSFLMEIDYFVCLEDNIVDLNRQVITNLRL